VLNDGKTLISLNNAYYKAGVTKNKCDTQWWKAGLKNQYMIENSKASKINSSRSGRKIHQVDDYEQEEVDDENNEIIQALNAVNYSEDSYPPDEEEKPWIYQN